MNSKAKTNLVLATDVQNQRCSKESTSYVIRDWYWIPHDEDDSPWLGCIVHVGSNFVLFQGPGIR